MKVVLWTTTIDRQTNRSKVMFWGLMALCTLLTVICVVLACSDSGQPWGSFSFNTFGGVMKANNQTDPVFRDTIVRAGSP